MAKNQIGNNRNRKETPHDIWRWCINHYKLWLFIIPTLFGGGYTLGYKISEISAKVEQNEKIQSYHEKISAQKENYDQDLRNASREIKELEKENFELKEQNQALRLRVEKYVLKYGEE